MSVLVSILLSVITVLLGIISFFLVRFFNKVDGIEKTLNKLSTDHAVSSEVQKTILKDVEEMEKSTSELSVVFARIQTEFLQVKNIILLKPST